MLPSHVIHLLTAILCGLTACAGFFYLARSGMVDRLAPFESPRRNVTRRRARRIGALAMLALAASLFLCVWELDTQPPRVILLLASLTTMSVALVLLVVCLVVDLYLTHRMRETLKRG